MTSPLNFNRAAPKKRKPKRRANGVAQAMALMKPAPEPVVPTGPLAGFDQFAAEDYSVKVPGRTDRYLTVSPLRAIMAEQDGVEEHVVTERTRQGVLYAAGLGIEHKIIARILGVDMETLQRLYPTELETAVHLMMNDIQTNMYNIARDPNHTQSVKSAVFLLGKLGNTLYRDRQAQSTALAIRPETRTIDPASLSDDQREALKDIIMSAMRMAGGGPPVIEGEYDEVSDEVSDDNAEDLV